MSVVDDSKKLEKLKSKFQYAISVGNKAYIVQLVADKNNKDILLRNEDIVRFALSYVFQHGSKKQFLDLSFAVYYTIKASILVDFIMDFANNGKKAQFMKMYAMLEYTVFANEPALREKKLEIENVDPLMEASKRAWSFAPIGFDTPTI